MNNFLTNMTMVNAHLVLEYAREYPTSLCGLNKEEYIIKISSRKITEELFKKIGVNNNEQKLTALRALDKIDRLGWTEVKKLLGKGRKDKSGDFTMGANLSSPNI